MRMGMLMMLIEMMAYVRMTVILDDWTTSPFSVDVLHYWSLKPIRGGHRR